MRMIGACLLLAAASAAAQVTADGPAVAARFPAPAVLDDAPALQPGRSSFTSNDELSALLRTLARRPGVHLLAAGRSQQGLPLEALLFTRGPGRPAVLLVGQQHGDEPAGAEALLALARRLAGGDALLEHLDVVLLPRANPDGAAAGARYTADGRDLNRDHLLLQTPEARAVAALVRAFDPVLVADLHEYPAHGPQAGKFGLLPRHDLLLQDAATPNLAPALAAAAERLFLAPLRAALDAQGLAHETYHTNPPTPGDLRLAMGGLVPDTLRNVAGLGHRVGVLLESRGADLGRQHLARRVHAHVVAATSLLKSAAAHAAPLAAMRRTLAQEARDAACRGRVVVLAAQQPEDRSMAMLEPETGADRAVAVTWLSSQQPRTLIERARPCGYWLAADAAPQADRLRQLGLAVERLAAPRTLAVETYREVGRGERGRVLQLVVATERRTLEAPAGSFVVGLDQPLAALAVAALEPDAPGGFVANRQLTALAGVARVVPAASAPAASAAQQ